jgi:hypothetical protein
VDVGISLTPPICNGGLANPAALVAFQSWHEFEICSGLVLGKNTIKFTTSNVLGYECQVGPGPGGFRCEISCAVKNCLWVGQSNGGGGFVWGLQEDGCPEGYICLEPDSAPADECDRIRTCCVEIYNDE